MSSFVIHIFKCDCKTKCECKDLGEIMNISENNDVTFDLKFSTDSDEFNEDIHEGFSPNDYFWR